MLAFMYEKCYSTGMSVPTYVGPGFAEKARDPQLGQRFCGPDGAVYTEKWWDDLETPFSRPPMAVTGSMIMQIVDESQGGKQSCALVSQLNGLVATGAIDSELAASTQQTLATDPQFSRPRYWNRTDTGNSIGWTNNPITLAFAMNKLYGMRIGVEYITGSADAPNDAADRMRSGHAVMLSGKSKVGDHARVAFEPEGSQGTFYLYDPKYPETTGIYPYDQLPQFQLTQDLAVF